MSLGFNPRRFGAMLVKESLQIARDPSTFLIAFVLPMLLLFLFGYGVNLDTARSRIGLSLQDNSEAAHSLAGSFQTSQWFDVRATGSVRELAPQMVGGQIRGIVVIPDGFGRQVSKGGGDIQVMTDGSLPNTASFIAAYAEGVRATWAAGQRSARDASPAHPDRPALLVQSRAEKPLFPGARLDRGGDDDGRHAANVARDRA